MSRNESRPMVPHRYTVRSKSREQRTPGIVLISTCASTPCIVLLVCMLIGVPIRHEQIVALLGECQRDFVFAITSESLIDQVIRRRPYVAAPVKLVRENGIIARNGGNYVCAPKLLEIQEMLLDHPLGLIGRGNAGKHRVEVCRREAV